MTPLYDAVFFDFDGVLCDSEPVHFACWNEILKPFEIEIPWDIYERECIGISDHDMIERVCGLRTPAADPSLVRAAYPRKGQLVLERLLAAEAITPDLIVLLDDLRPNYKLAVVTSSGQRQVQPVLEASGVLSRLDATVYGRDVQRLKPAPDPYLLAAERTGATRPLVVEDSAAGVASARAAGFDVIQVAAQTEVVPAVRKALGL